MTIIITKGQQGPNGGGTVVDATSSAKGKLKLARDISGTADLPTVVGIQGRDVLSTTPTTGRGYFYNGTSFAPQTTYGADHAIRTERPPKEYNVLDYGATGLASDFSTGSDDAIHLALTEALAYGGGEIPTVYFPGKSQAGASSSVYRLLKPLRINRAVGNAVVIRGDGSSTQLACAFNGWGIHVGGTLAPRFVTALVPPFSGNPAGQGWRNISATSKRRFIGLNDTGRVWHLNGLAAFTIEFFMKLNATQVGSITAFLGSRGFLTLARQHSGLFVSTTNIFAVTDQLQFQVDIGGTAVNLRPVAGLSVGATYHVAYTYDGSTARLFVTNLSGATTVVLADDSAASGTVVQEDYEQTVLGLIPSRCSLSGDTAFEQTDVTIQGLRLSNVARYTTGAETCPTTAWDRLAPDVNTLFILNFDETYASDMHVAYARGPYFLPTYLPERTTNLDAPNCCSVIIEDLELQGMSGLSIVQAWRSRVHGLSLNNQESALMVNFCLYGDFDFTAIGGALGSGAFGVNTSICNFSTFRRVSVLPGSSIGWASDGDFGCLAEAVALNDGKVAGFVCTSSVFCFSNFLCDNESLQVAPLAGVILSESSDTHFINAVFSAGWFDPGAGFAPKAAYAIIVDAPQRILVRQGEILFSSNGSVDAAILVERPPVAANHFGGTCRFPIDLETYVIDAASSPDYDFELLGNGTAYPRTLTSSTDATPIVVTASAAHGLATGDRVFIVGHTTNVAANGAWVVTVTGSTTFSLDTSAGSGAGVGAAGTVELAYGAPILVHPINEVGAVSWEMAADVNEAMPHHIAMFRDITVTSAVNLTVTRKVAPLVSFHGLRRRITNSTSGAQSIAVVVGASSVTITTGATKELLFTAAGVEAV